jgi:predicted transposase YbfD/YdcC
MDAQATAVFLRFFLDLKDPRRHNVRHVFTDLLTIAILAVLCKSDDWTEVVEWATANRPWLATFLTLPKGIPSADTFRRLFARIDPAGFERCFVNWTRALARACEGRLIALDGKALRHSFAHAWDRQAVHLVSAWCVQNQLVLGQLAVDSKGNEITVLPALLDLLNLHGATIVTIDAMGCQREIAQKIVENGGDYVLAVKDNQPTLHQKVKGLLDEAILDGFGQTRHDRVEQGDDGHGRIESRTLWVTDEVNWLGTDLLALWPGLASVAVVESVRQDLGDLTGKVTTERRYFISSLKGCKPGSARRMAQAVRGHWGVENQLHWQLDMSFGEDDSRLRVGHGAQNFSRLRRIVLNKLKSDPRKVSLKVKRYRCSIDRDYLLERLRQ